MSDPNLHWDGTRWLRWDGTQWVDAAGGTPGLPASADGVGAGPARVRKNPTTLIITIVAGVLILVLIIGVVLVVVTNRSGNKPTATTPTPTPSPTAPTTPGPTTRTPTTSAPAPDQLATLYFVNAEPGATVYAAGVKTKGNQASGWAGTLRSGDLICFNGTVANGKLTGTLVTPSSEGGGPLVKQPFSWRATGEGANLKLLEVGTVAPMTEVPVTTVNNYAALPAGDSWQQTFDHCASLTGGLS